MPPSSGQVFWLILPPVSITAFTFEFILNSRRGNAFGPEPALRQTAFFRPHNRSEDVRGLYLVGGPATNRAVGSLAS